VSRALDRECEIRAEGTVISEMEGRTDPSKRFALARRRACTGHANNHEILIDKGI
jgi:hypothetical protein